MNKYKEIQRELSKGWNTWNTRSVLSHVLLPECFSINLGIKEYDQRNYLKEALIGRNEPDAEQIRPGLHAYNGSFTELKLTWKGIEVSIQSATEGDDLVLLVTPEKLPSLRKNPMLVIESGILWGRGGKLSKNSDTLLGEFSSRSVVVYTTQPNSVDDHLPVQTPYLAVQLDGPIGLSTGLDRDIDTIRDIINRKRLEEEVNAQCFGELAEVYQVIHCVLAWNTIYEPEGRRVVTPVSRMYNVNWGGYVLFEWDTFFAAYMASLDNRELAYANVFEILHGKTDDGFIPNEVFVNNLKSRGWSQPPVGSLVTREIYRRYREKWFLEAVFDDLLTWNRWWQSNRLNGDLLCWGAEPYKPIIGCRYEYDGMNSWQGAVWESGLDNSPMYDGVPFNPETHLLELCDVGLNALYITDCMALADIARVLGKPREADELSQRAGLFTKSFDTLWNESRGIYLNRRTDNGELSPRISPTNFYPLIGQIPNKEQAQRLVEEHIVNPTEFWGEWILPSISRDDPAFKDQDYWRGRIWGPMNFLVYLGLRMYGFHSLCGKLAEQSKRLLLKEWHEQGHIHENFNAINGLGCDILTSDRFYHWGGLLGFLALMEAGYIEGPEISIE